MDLWIFSVSSFIALLQLTRKNLMAKNLKRLKKQLEREYGKHEAAKYPWNLKSALRHIIFLSSVLINSQSWRRHGSVGWLSEQDVPGLILCNFNVCFDFPLIHVAIALIPEKQGTDGGRGVKGAPSVSIGTSIVTEGTTSVKLSAFTFTFLYTLLCCLDIHVHCFWQSTRTSKTVDQFKLRSFF